MSETKAAQEEKPKENLSFFAIAFTLAKAVTGEKTQKQVKGFLRDYLLPYGPVDEIRVLTTDAGFEVTVFFPTAVS